MRRVGELDETRVTADLGEHLRDAGSEIRVAPPPRTSTGKELSNSGGLLAIGGCATVGLGQSRQAVYASVFSSCASHSSLLNGLNVAAGSAASPAASSCSRGAGLASISNSCG